jgi:hypothetical protein
MIKIEKPSNFIKIERVNNNEYHYYYFDNVKNKTVISMLNFDNGDVYFNEKWYQTEEERQELKEFLQNESNTTDEELKNNKELINQKQKLLSNLKENYKQARQISFYIFEQDAKTEKQLFTLKTDTNDYKGFLSKIKDSQGSILKYRTNDKEKALKTQNFYIRLENNQTFLIEAVNYLWEYGLEEVLIVIENIKFQFETILQTIENSNSLDDLNNIDVTIKNHNDEPLQEIKINLFKVCNHILEHGKDTEGNCIDFEDSRYINVEGVRVEQVMMFPNEIVKAVDDVMKNNKLLTPISEVYSEDRKNNFLNTISNSFLEI